MIKLQDLITEIAWKETAIEHMYKNRIPLTQKIVDTIIGDVDVPTFHVTDLDGLKKLKKMQGTAKALSTFTSTANDNAKDLYGIKTSGGFLVHLIGKLKLASPEDIMSRPDERGIRWVDTDTSNSSSLTTMLNNITTNNIGNNIENDVSYIYDEVQHKVNKTRADKSRLDHMLGAKTNYKKELKQLGIKMLKVYESKLLKILKKYQKVLQKQFGEPRRHKGDYHWNELVVDRIMIVDVLRWHEHYDRLYTIGSESNSGNWGEDKKHKDTFAARKMFGNKLDIATWSDEIKDWLSDRGGDAF